eukprot:TRINITY_DN6384_c0_g1_i1.p1 TRINITY_DN6384_c0_g1~~TRINITY_DN6384_c0_g1_i1.p1  ORF type:complete len:213 (+),score=78.49 TRINITY_DN6384_c0_g1_i1:57-641(+)
MEENDKNTEEKKATQSSPAQVDGNGKPDLSDFDLDEEMMEELKKIMDGKNFDLGEDFKLDMDDETFAKMEQDFEDKPELQQAMSDLLEKFVAKDMLYDPMKEMQDKYPEWLKENRGKIPQEEYDRFQKHFECISRICKVYESESHTSAEILPLFKELETLGTPPAKLMEDMGDGVFTPDLLSSLTSDPNQCSVM